MNPRLKVCVALSALALSAMLPAAAERGAHGFLDRAKSVLREEARSFHEDVTSSNRWREWALHRANGEETDVQGWLSSRWEETPVRLADGYAASLADWAAADLRESDWVETLDFSFQLPIEGRSGRLNVSAIGPLARGLWGGDGVLGWQFPLAAGSAEDGNTELSGNVGLFYRQVLGGSGLAGLNVFGDYQDEGLDGSFWRWSLGAEYRTAWADVYANRYFPSAVSHRRLLSGGESERIVYSAGGYDAEVRFHAPGSDWLEGFAEYSLWEGEHGDGDEEGFRYGFRFSPRTGGVADGFRLEADYDAAGGGLGGRFDYSWTVGEFRRIGGASAFDPRAHFYTPVARRHDQEIRARVRSVLRFGRAVARGAGVSGDDCGSTASVSLTAEAAAEANKRLTTHVIAGDYDGVCGALRGGASPSYRSSPGGREPLHYAATLSVSDAVRIVSVLLSAGAGVDARWGRDAGGAGETPLHLAAAVDAGQVAGVLAAAGANMEAADAFDYRPLHIAAEFEATAVIKVMLDRSGSAAHVNATITFSGERRGRSVHGASPLDLAIAGNGSGAGHRDAAIYLLAYDGKCARSSHGWCDAESFPVPVSSFGGGATLVAAGYEGTVGVMSAVVSELGGLELAYTLAAGGEDFVFDAATRAVRTKRPLEEGDRRAVVEVSAAKGRLAPVTLSATLQVAVSAPPGNLTLSYLSNVTAAAGYMGVAATLSATEEGATVSYHSGLDAGVFSLAVLPSGKAALSLTSPLGGEGAVAAAVVELRKHGYIPATVAALVTVSALGPFDPEAKEIEADHAGAVHQFTLPGFESASFSALEGSSQDFEVSSDGAVSRKENVILEGEAVYTVAVEAEDEGFLGAVSLTLGVSVHRKEARAEFSASSGRYRAALAGGYAGAVLTLSSADERVSLSYLGGLDDGSAFSLVSLSSGDYVLSLGAAVSGPDIAVLEPIFEFQRTGFWSATATADIRVTALGLYSHTEVIQRSATVVAYRFVVPGFAGARFREVGESGDFYSVLENGKIILTATMALTASVSHTIVVRGEDEGLLGEALFTLALSVSSFCDADAVSEDGGAVEDRLVYEAVMDGETERVCELLRRTSIHRFF